MPMHDSGVPEQPNSESNVGKGDVPEAPAQPPELPRWANKNKVSTPFSEERMAAFIGPRWESTYRRKLAGFFADPAFAVTWNWAAFLVGPIWFFYRKLYLAFGIFWIASQVLAARLFVGFEQEALSPQALSTSEGKPVLMILGGLYLTINLASAGTANWFLFRRARFKSLVVTVQQVPEDVAISRLQRVGGVALLPVILLLLLQLAFAFAAANAPA